VDAEPTAAARGDVEASDPSRRLRGPLPREEHEPTLGQEEKETSTVRLETDEPAEPRARELDA